MRKQPGIAEVDQSASRCCDLRRISADAATQTPGSVQADMDHTPAGPRGPGTYGSARWTGASADCGVREWAPGPIYNASLRNGETDGPLIAARTPPRTTKGFIWNNIPVNTKHLCNICTMSVQRRRRWADVVRMLYKCFVFAEIPCVCGSPWTPTSTVQQSKHPTLSTSCIPVNTTHLYNICTMSAQRRRRWADVVQLLYKWFVFAEMAQQVNVNIHSHCVQCWTSVGDVVPTLYKWYTNGLCLLRWHNKSTWIYTALLKL